MEPAFTKSSGLFKSEGWAAGSWFVPVVSFWWPYRILKDIWTETQRLVDPASRISNELIGGFWALWIIQLVIGSSLSSLSRSARDFNDVQNILFLETCGSIISIIGTCLLILIIKKMTVFENSLQEKMAEEGNTNQEVISPAL